MKTEKQNLFELVQDLQSRLENNQFEIRGIESLAIEHACRFLNSIQTLTAVATELSAKGRFKESDALMAEASQYVEGVSKYNGRDPVYPGSNSNQKNILSLTYYEDGISIAQCSLCQAKTQLCLRLSDYIAPFDLGREYSIPSLSPVKFCPACGKPFTHAKQLR